MLPLKPNAALCVHIYDVELRLPYPVRELYGPHLFWSYIGATNLVRYCCSRHSARKRCALMLQVRSRFSEHYVHEIVVETWNSRAYCIATGRQPIEQFCLSDFVTVPTVPHIWPTCECAEMLNEKH